MIQVQKQPAGVITMYALPSMLFAQRRVTRSNEIRRNQVQGRSQITIILQEESVKIIRSGKPLALGISQPKL